MVTKSAPRKIPVTPGTPNRRRANGERCAAAESGKSAVQAYLTTIVLLERMHRQFLEVLKAELDRLEIRDINNVQALVLYNIGHDKLTVGELTLRGYYLGSNVSYNVKKLTEHGFLNHERSPHDRPRVP